jgi:tRNA G18 (ribose-2'-O)-methylase SpoU
VIHYVRTLDDPRVADYARTGDGPWLKAHGLFVAEGRIVIRRLIESQRFSIHSIFATPAAAAALTPHVPDGLDVYVADASVLNAVAGFNFHRRCLALAVRSQPLALEAFRDSRRLVALEGIGNPDNVGGIFRTAAAFDVDGIVIDTATADPFYRKAVRTGMGAVFRIPFFRAEALPPALRDLRALGFRVAAFTPRSDAVPLPEFARKRYERLVLAFGSEGSGLSPESLLVADDAVRIPIRSEVDSLNVTVAAGIALAGIFLGP